MLHFPNSKTTGHSILFWLTGCGEHAMKRPQIKYLASGFLLILLVILLAAYPRRGPFAADLSRGKILYDAHCAACHGISGDGRGPQAANFTPAPTDFTSATVMANIPFELNEQVVAQGKQGTRMPGFAMVLSSEEIQDVIAYQRAFPKQ